MSKRKVAPSEKVAKLIEMLVNGEHPEELDGAGLLGRLAHLGAQKVIQEALEKEQAEHLERGRYERRTEEGPALYRNGYEVARLLLGEGPVEIQRPQVRGGAEPYRSRLWELLATRTEAVERLVVEMYARGLSTRDIEDLFRTPEGEVLLSRTSVSEITDELWEEYEAFSQRDLSGLPVAYLIVDGVYEAMRRLGQVRDGILVAWGILEDGRRLLIHLEVGNRESYESCVGFLRGLKARGLPDPVLVTSDGAPGMIRAIDEVFGLSLRQRCLVHKKANVLAKVPETEKSAVGSFPECHLQRAESGDRPHAGRRVRGEVPGEPSDCGPSFPGRPRGVPRSSALPGDPPQGDPHDQRHRAGVRGAPAPDEGDPPVLQRAELPQAGLCRAGTGGPTGPARAHE